MPSLCTRRAILLRVLHCGVSDSGFQFPVESNWSRQVSRHDQTDIGQASSQAS